MNEYDYIEHAHSNDFISFDCKHCGQNNRINFYPTSASTSTTTNYYIQKSSNAASTVAKGNINSSSKKLPDGLEQFLLEFTIDILKRKPHDLKQFGYEYFLNKRNEAMETKTASSRMLNRINLSYNSSKGILEFIFYKSMLALGNRGILVLLGHQTFCLV